MKLAAELSQLQRLKRYSNKSAVACTAHLQMQCCTACTSLDFSRHTVPIKQLLLCCPMQQDQVLPFKCKAALHSCIVELICVVPQPCTSCVLLQSAHLGQVHQQEARSVEKRRGKHSMEGAGEGFVHNIVRVVQLCPVLYLSALAPSFLCTLLATGRGTLHNVSPKSCACMCSIGVPMDGDRLVELRQHCTDYAKVKILWW